MKKNGSIKTIIKAPLSAKAISKKSINQASSAFSFAGFFLG